VADQNRPGPDPFTAWRDWLNQAERQLNSLFNEVMGTEQYTRFMGQFNDLSMNMQKNMNETMGRYLSSLNLPTRDDLAALGQRLAAIEDRLGAIGSGGKPAVQGVATTSVAPVATPRPPRTRKPVPAGGSGR
jgi:polyhydroxyalkanoic acid synthase PhaR subunit